MFVVACGESDGDDGAATTNDASSEGSASTTAPTSSTDPSTSASSTETMSTSDTTTASTSTATTADTEDATTSADDSTTTSDSDDTAATPCGDGMCGADEVCVLPCCGGPAPGCEDSDENGECANGQEPTPADQCGSGCNTKLCCPMLPCMADPPFCASAADLQCHETQCSLDSCFGSLQDDQLMCECA